tara:strand:+ start:306 stop:743 length:438 start_codon:yes stop_codon:yes gene_type:complete
MSLKELLEISDNILRKNTIYPEGWYSCVNTSFGLEIRLEIFFFKKDEVLLSNVFIISNNQFFFEDREIKGTKYTMDKIDCNDCRELIFDEKIKIGLQGSVVSYFNCVYNTKTNTFLVKIIMEIPLIPEVNMESIMKNVKKPLGAY